MAGFSSCISPKRVLYFQNVPDSVTTNKPYIIDSVTKFVSPTILPNDVLAITIQTIQQNESSTPIQPAKGTFDPLSGYLVDKNGNIEISLIGFVKVAGLTTSEARELLKEKAKEFYKEPVVSVRIANFDIYFLGEITNHGPLFFPSEKVNILEALATAGDVLMSGKRNNLLLIRTEGDRKELVRFSLLNTDLFRSPYFYLKQKDMIYVEPSKYKIQQSDNRLSKNLAIISGIIGLGTLVLSVRNLK
jgi:polysaccharide export outer membrane protein